MLALGLALLQTASSGLEVRASFAQGNATYAEFGAWVQRTTGVNIRVASSISERKIALFVKDRPVGETMKRVAEALLLEWEPSGAGFSLRLQPEVAEEEKAVTEATLREARETLWRELGQAIRLANHQDDPLERSLRNAQRERQSFEGVVGEPAEQARLRYERLRDEVASRRLLGTVWSALNPAQRDDFWAGMPVVAADGPIPRTVALPREATAEAKEVFGAGEGPFRVSLERTPNGTGIDFWVDGHVLFRLGGPRPSFLVPDTLLDQRLKAWAKSLDQTVNRMPLRPREGSLPLSRATGYLCLGDCLLSLHRRTGLPIVADGLRVPVMAESVPDGRDVSDWLTHLNFGAGNVSGRHDGIARSDGGWLMVRTRRYWDLLSEEAPERLLRDLEKAGRRSEGPSLEAYAEFASRLSPESQRPMVFGTVALDVSLAPLVYSKNLLFLRLWGALSPAQRTTARTAGGLLVSRMTRSQQSLCLAALATRIANARAPEAVAAEVLGLSPLPQNLRLFVGPDSDTPAVELLTAGSDGSPYPLRIGPRTSDGVVGALGMPHQAAQVNFVIPLRPVSRG